MKKAKFKIIPRGKQILVKPEEEKSKVSEHGIYSPSNMEKEKRSVGTILAHGKKVEDDIKVGKKVIYAAFVGEKIGIQESEKEVEYILLHDEDVLAFIE